MSLFYGWQTREGKGYYMRGLEIRKRVEERDSCVCKYCGAYSNYLTTKPGFNLESYIRGKSLKPSDFITVCIRCQNKLYNDRKRSWEKEMVPCKHIGYITLSVDGEIIQKRAQLKENATINYKQNPGVEYRG